MVKSPSDGYTLLLVGLNTYGAQPHLNKKLPYDVLKDLTPINNAIVSPLVVSVHPSVPAKHIREPIADAKANPGKVNCGSAGVENTLQLLLMFDLAQTPLQHISTQRQSSPPGYSGSPRTPRSAQSRAACRSPVSCTATC